MDGGALVDTIGCTSHPTVRSGLDQWLKVQRDAWQKEFHGDDGVDWGGCFKSSSHSLVVSILRWCQNWASICSDNLIGLVYVCLCMFMYVYVCLCMFMYVYVCLCMFMWRPHSSFQNWLNGQTGYGFFSSISWRIQPYFDAFPRTLHRKFGHCPAGFTTARLAPTCSNL